MMISWIWTGMLLVSLIFGRGTGLSAAALEGAREGITLTVSMAGGICLWSGVGRLMEAVGLTNRLAELLRPLLGRLFPGSRTDPALARDLSANICANLLGLGNAATPMGISAARRMKQGDEATDELCRLIVLNTASIQLLPTNVAAIRSALGAASPFGILPAVWVTSFLSAGAGLLAAACMGKLWSRA